MSAETVVYEISVRRADLAEAIGFATSGVRKNKTAILRFTFDGFLFQVIGPGASQVVPSTGHWPAAVAVDAAIIQKLATRLPNVDPVVLKAVNDRFYVAGFSVGADISETASSPITLPIDHTSADILVALVRLDEASVVAATGRPALDKARRELDAQIAKAVQALASYGISISDIEPIVHRAIRKKAGVD